MEEETSDSGFEYEIEYEGINYPVSGEQLLHMKLLEDISKSLKSISVSLKDIYKYGAG